MRDILIVLIFIYVTESGMDNNIVHWYSLKGTTEYLGASRDTIMKWITTNEILSAKLDGCGNSRLAKWPLTMKSGAAADR